MHKLLVFLLFICTPQWVMAIPAVRTLDTDIPTWLITDHTVPVVSVVLHFDASGSASDPIDKQGLASLASTLLSEGAGDMDAASFQAYLNQNALQLNASLGRDSLTVSLYALREHVEEGFHALQLLLTQPRLDAESLERVRGQALASLRIEQQSPGYHASRTMSQALYGDHPYSYASDGTEETLAAITLEDVHGYLKKAINPERLRVSVAGAIDKETLEDAIERLSVLEEVEAPLPLPEATPAIVRAETIGINFDGPQSQIRFAMPAIKRNHPDFYAAHVLAHILGGNGLTSILAEEIRQKRGLTYGVNSWLDVSDYTAHMRGQLSTATATRDEAIEVLNQTLNDVYENGVSQALRDQAVSYLTGAFPLRLDSTGSMASYLRLMQHYDLGKDYLKNRNSYFEAVTLEAVNRVAKKILSPEQRIIVWAGKEVAVE